jgi:hypothetical protein
LALDVLQCFALQQQCSQAAEQDLLAVEREDGDTQAVSRRVGRIDVSRDSSRAAVLLVELRRRHSDKCRVQVPKSFNLLVKSYLPTPELVA